MDEVIFRDAALADLPAIVALLAEDTLGEKREDSSLPLDPRYEAAFAAIEADPNQRLIVAETGCLQLTFIPGIAFRGGWRGLIEAVRVAGGLRGQGIGERLMAYAVAACRDDDPPLFDVGPAHGAACIRWQDVRREAGEAGR